MRAILKRCLEANENSEVESLGELARLLNKPLRTLDNWVIRGLPRRKVSPRRFAYNLKDVAIWIFQNIEGENPEIGEPDTTFKWRLKYACSANEVIALKKILSDLPAIIKRTFVSPGNKSADKALLEWIDEQMELYEEGRLQDLKKALTKYDEYLAESEAAE